MQEETIQIWHKFNPNTDEKTIKRLIKTSRYSQDLLNNKKICRHCGGSPWHKSSCVILNEIRRLAKKVRPV